MDIPVIDIQRSPDVVRQLDAACRDWGFFQIINHGVPPDLIAAMHREMHAFFALPIEDKHAIERTATNSWGFYDRELTKNIRDWKQVFDFGPDETAGPLAGQHAQWPAQLPTFRPTMEAFSAECERVGFWLLGQLAHALDVPPARVRAAFEPRHTSFLRLNYYPTCDDPAPASSPTGGPGTFGIGHHTDSGVLTVLLQDDQPGLQVLHDNTWNLVEPRRDALVINIGDVVQVWSNDRYPAALHRVIANRAERYSAPYFFNPSPDAMYAPLVGEAPHYRPIQWGEFRAKRTAGDYADYGAEIQIADYRI